MDNQYSTIAENARVLHRAQLEHPVNLAPFSEIHNDSSVGRFFVLNYRSVVYRNVSIGRYCSIGRGCEIGAARHPMDSLSTHGFQYEVSGFRHYPGYDFIRSTFDPHPLTTLGSDVWIGAQSIVLSGVTVGHGSIIGANSVVRENVAPYTVVAGSPAREIRTRFSEKTREELLNLKWWDLEPDLIFTLPFHDIDSCVFKLKEIRDKARHFQSSID